ncbi:MAG: 3-keto-disaccharide hydrolase [Candidatus Nanoarchaeia archaeon]
MSKLHHPEISKLTQGATLVILILSLILLGLTLLDKNELSNIKNLDKELTLKLENNEEIQTISLLKEGIKISQFQTNSSENIDLIDLVADTKENKALMHSPSKELQNISLYVPRNPGDTLVRICVNASSFEQIREGCGLYPDITLEYVLKIGDPDLDLTADNKFFIVRNIKGTGGQSESDWWNKSYQSRKAINITPANSTLTSSYTLDLYVDTINLIDSGKLRSDGNDLRIVYWNGTTNVEIDRINITQFNTSNTHIEFKIQNNITNTTNNYVMYYNNPLAIDPPINKTKIYYLWEDFEDQINEFTEGPLNPVINTNSKKNGNYGLEGDGLAGYRRAVKPEVLPRGMSIEGWVYSGYAGDNADLPGLAFGMQPSGDQRNGYQVVLDWRSATGGSADMHIRKNYGTTPLATSTEGTVLADTWYYIRTYWHSNGNINITIYDTNMNYFGSMNLNDQSYTSGYYGVAAYRDGFWDDIKVKLQIIDLPNITLGQEELNGPLIENAKAIPTLTYRNEYVNITATITSDKGINLVWVNITLPNTSIEKIYLNNISSSYNLTYVVTELGNYSAKIYSNDSIGTISESAQLNWQTNGWSEISKANLSSTSIYQGDTYTITCKVTDTNTTTDIINYTVNFYSNESGLLGFNTTNYEGIAILTQVDTTLGYELITCNITSQNYYNASSINEATMIIETLTPPVLTILNLETDRSTYGYGNNVTISTNITSPNTIDTVSANITAPNNISTIINLVYNSGHTYKERFQGTWEKGNYTYKLIANDSIGTVKTSESKTFTVTSNINIALQTNNDKYGPNDIVSLTQGVSGWWDAAYKYRKKITVTNNDFSNLKENYSVKLVVDTSSLIAASKMLVNCNDLRVIWTNGSNQKQLDRVLETPCNSLTTQVWFALQKNISANNTTDEYYIYYGKNNASNPPNDENKVYLVWDNFEDYAENTTPDNGWINDPEYNTNNWQIKTDSGNKVLQDITTDGVYHRIYNGEDGWNDYQIEAKIKLDSFLFSGIAFRRQPQNINWYDQYTMIADDRASTNKLTLRRWTGGASNYQQLANDNTDFDGLTWQNYTIKIVGNTASIFRNDILYITYDISDSSPTYTTGSYIGLMSHEGQSMFDDIKVRLLVNNEPTSSFGTEEFKSASSEIVELEETEHNVYLFAIIQNNNTGDWQNIHTVINDTSTNITRIIGTGNSIDLSNVWATAGYWNTSNMDSGKYRLNIALADPDGITLKNTNNSNIEEFSYFTIDSSPPNISIISPTNNSGDNDGLIVFRYTVSDDANISNCALYLNNIYIKQKTNIAKDIEQNITHNLNVGSYEWAVKCADSYGEIGTSNTNTITIIHTSSYSGKTTNLSDVDVNNISNLIIEQPESGMINFSEPVNLSGGADFDNYVLIKHNFISVNSVTLPQLNKSATLTFYNLSLLNPIILKDNEPCTDCNIVTYTSNSLVFNVPHFSTYTASENSQIIIWDETELMLKHPFENVTFYANYTNTTSGLPIIGATCTILFNDSSHIMTYNAELYSFTRNFTYSDIFEYNISCDGSSQGYTPLTIDDYASINNVGGPQGVSDIEVLNSERANTTIVPESILITAGNVSLLSINGTGITQSWQGYYGNIFGTIYLNNGEGKTFYDWNLTNPSGEIYASRAIDVNFATLHCSNPADIITEESYLNHTSTSSDSVTNTFNQNTHPEFSTGIINIPQNTCPSTTVSGFFEVLLIDNANNIIYTSLIESDKEGFDLEPYDFQMIVGENGQNNNADITPYYFFVEII